jgi:hypothetical protein
MVTAMMYPCGPIRQWQPAAAAQAQPQVPVAGSLAIGRPPVTMAWGRRISERRRKTAVLCATNVERSLPCR